MVRVVGTPSGAIALTETDGGANDDAKGFFSQHYGHAHFLLFFTHYSCCPLARFVDLVYLNKAINVCCQ